MYSGSKSDPTPRCLATTGLSLVDAENGVTVEGCCCLSFIGYQRLPFPPYQNVITYQQKRYSFNIDADYYIYLKVEKDGVIIHERYWQDYNDGASCDNGYFIGWYMGNLLGICPATIKITAGQAYRLRIPGSPLQMCSYTEDSYNYEGDTKQCDIH